MLCVHACVSVVCLCCDLLHYSPAYQIALLPPVEAAIRQLHKTVGNADTDGYTIVYGVGATNVLYMTITALSRSIIDVSYSS